MRKEPRLYRILRFIFIPIFSVAWRPKIINKSVIPTSGRIIMAGNHIHAADPVLLAMCTKRTVRVLAKKELYKGPFKPFFYALGALPVDKDRNNSKMKDEVIDHLNNEGALGISPEGKRNKTSEKLLPFKYGAVNFAKKTNTKIIPYAITGKYHIFNNKLKIVFGAPLDISELELEDANKLLYDSVLALLEGETK